MTALSSHLADLEIVIIKRSLNQVCSGYCMWLFTHILYCQINVAVVIPASYLPSPPSLSSALSPPFPLPLDGQRSGAAHRRDSGERHYAGGTLPASDPQIVNHADYPWSEERRASFVDADRVAGYVASSTGEKTANLRSNNRRTLFHGACEEIACWLRGWLRARNFAARD